MSSSMQDKRKGLDSRFCVVNLTEMTTGSVWMGSAAGAAALLGPESGAMTSPSCVRSTTSFITPSSRRHAVDGQWCLQLQPDTDVRGYGLARSAGTRYPTH